MSDVFISYSREDRPTVAKLAKALEEQGWSVWWDRRIPAGRTFDEVIEQALDAARCVLVVWSSRSVTSTWVRAEAGEGLSREILVPVLIEDTRVPLAFRPLQAADLINWDGSPTASYFRRLVTDMERILGLARPMRGARPLELKTVRRKPLKPVETDKDVGEGGQRPVSHQARKAQKLLGAGNIEKARALLAEWRMTASVTSKGVRSESWKEATYWLGICEQAAGNLDKSEKLLHDVLSHHPSDDKTCCALGLVREALGNQKSAIRAFKRGAKLGNQEAARKLHELGIEWE